MGRERREGRRIDLDSPSLPPPIITAKSPFSFLANWKSPPSPPPTFFPPVFPPPFFSDPVLLSLSVLLSSSFQRRKLGKEKVVKAGHFPSFPPCHSSLLLLLFISPPLVLVVNSGAGEEGGKELRFVGADAHKPFSFFASYFVSQFSPPTRPFLGKEEEKHILMAPLFSASVS